MNPQIIALAIEELPQLIGFFKGLFAAKNPGAPIPTDAEVIAAYLSALASSLAKDSDWLATHPATP